MARITCPSDCAHLESNSHYQEQRIGEQFGQARQEFYNGLFETGGETATALFHLVEIVSFRYFQGRRDGQDADVIAAMQALRRSLSPLYTPGDMGQTLFAEQLKKDYEAFAQHQAEIGKARPAIDQQTETEVLDRGLAFVTDFSGTEFQSRRFLTGVIGYTRVFRPEIAAHLAKQPDGGRIMLTGELGALSTPPRPSGPLHDGPQHTHGPGCQHHHH